MRERDRIERKKIRREREKERGGKEEREKEEIEREKERGKVKYKEKKKISRDVQNRLPRPYPPGRVWGEAHGEGGQLRRAHHRHRAVPRRARRAQVRRRPRPDLKTL